MAVGDDVRVVVSCESWTLAWVGLPCGTHMSGKGVLIFWR
jgi:hypothetical protein